MRFNGNRLIGQVGKRNPIGQVGSVGPFDLHPVGV
jgi:hypothetical protein